MNPKKAYELEIKQSLIVVTAICKRHNLTEDEVYDLENIQDFIAIAYGEDTCSAKKAKKD